MADAGLVRLARPLYTLAAVALGTMLLSACASSAPTTPSTTSTSAAASSAAVSSDAAPTTATSVDTAAAGTSTATGKPTTLTGTVEAGVEANCVVLVGDDGAVQANLIGLDTVTAPFGSTVEVTGTFETDMMTTCQQGEPFTVTDVQIR